MSHINPGHPTRNVTKLCLGGPSVRVVFNSTARIWPRAHASVHAIAAPAPHGACGGPGGSRLPGGCALSSVVLNSINHQESRPVGRAYTFTANGYNLTPRHRTGVWLTTRNSRLKTQDSRLEGCVLSHQTSEPRNGSLESFRMSLCGNTKVLTSRIKTHS